MDPLHQNRSLDFAFCASSLVLVALVTVAVAREAKRPPVAEQRIVPALGVVDRCEGCHDASGHSAILTNTHPVERFGCTPCHGGQGLATTADTAHRAHPDWEHPLFSPLEREAACGNCHLGDDIRGAPVLSAGRRALRDRGCAGCHEIEGLSPPNIAPSLDGLKDKVQPAWVRAWLADPARVDPQHKMPRFSLTSDQIEALVAFLFTLPGPELTNTRPEPAALRPAPVSPAVRAPSRKGYSPRASTKASPHEKPQTVSARGIVTASPPQGDADRGRVAIATRRCATCHLIEGRGGSFAPSLDAAGAKISGKWLFSFLTDTHRMRPKTRMPGFRLPDAETADIVAYAGEQLVPDGDVPWAKLEGEPQAERAALGRTLFTDLGCRGCHEVTGIPFVRVGMPLTGIADRHIADLPRGASPGDVADIPTWVSTKARTPRAFDLQGAIPSKMPAFQLDEAEARGIGVAVAAMHAAKPPAAYIRAPAAAMTVVPPGVVGRLVDRFRCLVCHRVGGQGGDISRVPLDGEGARVQRAWLERFLQSPTTLRMDQPERMPVLGIDAEDASRLAAWMESSLGDDRIAEEAPVRSEELVKGKGLFALRGCRSCHVAEGEGTMKGPVLDGSRDRLRVGYVTALLTRGPEVVPERRHPPATYEGDEARAIAAYVCSLGAK